MDDSVSTGSGEYKGGIETISTYSWSEDESSRAYEITGSSNHALPLRLVDRRHQIEGPWRGYRQVADRTEGSISANLPSDFHLHELTDINPTDTDAVVNFCNTHGLLWLPKPVLESIGLPGVSSALNTRVEPPWHRNHESLIDIAEIQMALRLLRAAVGTWINYRATGKLAPAWADQGLQTPIGDDQAMRWFGEVINPGLVSAHPAVVLVDASNTGQTPASGLGAVHVVSLYDAICARIYNDVVTGGAYSYCQNEPCGRPFLTQRKTEGRSKVRTAGLRFCSEQCKRAQDSREYRRRKRGQATSGS